PTVVETLTRGRSLGKLATGVRVVRDDGGPVRLRHALVRALVGVGELWFTAGSLAIISAAVNRRGKRLGDLLAGTYAVRVRDGARAEPPLIMPPELAHWARTADIRALPDGLGLAARRFLARTGTMSPAPRARLGTDLAARVEPYVSPPAPWGTHPERFLAAVLVARRDREYESGLRSQARQNEDRDRLRALPHEIPEG
ncbi:RDD family protein, partial [Georgenia sp. 10Sc9-8]|nr:RDD family protein [Georgenia halotolerans]